MKFSVITVCYNSVRTIERTLQSVAKQDWPTVEHIVIDGGSTDGTREILEKSRSQLSCLVSEPDKGIYDAMNKGLALATGDIICFLNSDDKYASVDVLSSVASQMRDHNLEALIGDVGFFRERNFTRMVRRYRSDRFHPELLGWGWMPAHPALFLRAEVIQRVGQFKTDYLIAGDFEFIVRVFHRQTISFRHFPHVLVHMQTGGVSDAGWRAKINLNKEVLRACRENGLDTNMLKILSKYPAKLMELFHR
jgi:glycosyltransferase involved in cell wall biosynthesis